MAEQTIRKADLPDDAVIILGDEPEASESEIEESEALNNMLADLGELDNVKVTVYRVKEGNKTSWVDSFAPSELDIEQLMMGLRADYGGGRFKIQVRESGRIKKSKIVEVEPPPKKAEGVDTREIIREVQQNQQQESNGMATILAEMIKANQDSQRHQSEQMTTFMTTMVNAMGNMNQNQAPAAPPPTMVELVTAMASLKDMSAPTPTAEPTELILKGVELVNAIRGDDGGSESNIYSVLSNAVKSFGGTLGQAMQLQQNAPTPQQLNVPPAQQPPAQLNAPAEDEIEPGVTGIERLPEDHPMAPFEPYVDYMLNLAKKDANPELYAEVIVDQMGLEFAHAWLATAEGLQTLHEQIPRTRDYASWFMLVGQVVDEMWQEEQNQADESHQDGDVSSGQRDSDSPPADPPTDAPSIDGNPIGASGHQDDIESHVAPGVTIENDNPDT